jgi:kumamolisin
MKPTRPPASSHKLQVTLYLRRCADPPVQGIEPISRQEFATKYGMSAQDADKVKSFARRFGLIIDEVDCPERRMVLSGTAAQFARAFRVKFVGWQDAQERVYRSYEGTIQIPADLAGVVVGVFGLDDLPQAAPREGG